MAEVYDNSACFSQTGVMAVSVSAELALPTQPLGWLVRDGN